MTEGSLVDQMMATAPLVKINFNGITPVTTRGAHNRQSSTLEAHKPKNMTPSSAKASKDFSNLYFAC